MLFFDRFAAAACVMRFELSESLRLAPATFAVTSITEVAAFVCWPLFVLFEAEVVCFEEDVVEVLVAAVAVPFVVGIEELVVVVVLVVADDAGFVSVTHFSYIFSSCFWVIQPGGHMP